MKIQFLTLLLVAGLAGPAWARLGETQDQLNGRYGDLKVLSKGEIDGVAVDMSGYVKTGFAVNAGLINNICVYEDFHKVSGDPLTNDEIKLLLAADSQGHSWKEGVFTQPRPPGPREWHRDDGTLAKLDSSGTTLIIEAKALIDAQAAAYKTAHATSLDGF